MRRAVGILMAAVVALVSACTDDESRRSRGNSSAPDPVSGGHAVVGVHGEPPTFDPYAPNATDLTRALVRPLYPSLFRVTPNGDIAADLADQLQGSGNRVRVRLAPARWSNGRPITARDVVASVLDATPPSGFAQVTSARVLSRQSVELRGPVRDWKATLARAAFVLPGGRASAPGGIFGGPYVLRKLVPGLKAVYVTNPRWNGEAPYLQRFTVTYVTSLLMMIRLLEDGRLDAAALPSSVNLDERLEEIGLRFAAALGYESVVLDFSSSGLARAERVAIAARVPLKLMQEGLIRDDGRISRTLFPTPESAGGGFGGDLGAGTRPGDAPLLLAPAGDELLQLIQRVIDARLDGRGVDVDLVRIVPSELYGGAAPVAGIQVVRAGGGPGAKDPRGALRTLDRYPLFQVETVTAWRPGLRGVVVNPTTEGPLHNVHRWWWAEGRRPGPGL
ncbi:MAG: ABC transporter substrate-binding protein [Actinomycetota bacterium]